ncbi:MAG: ABC transporter ATP-binding protein [Acidobacteriota bacterium]|nr:ABC transporter ATP-binding protein [Acidobacteriota bacterium]
MSGADPGRPAIVLRGVSRDFETPGGATYCAVRDVSLAVAPGAFVSIVGPTGCGKSTLLNLVAGLLAPTAGQVEIGGVPLAGLNRRATYMFQQDALLPWKSVLDNVGLGLVFAGRPRDEARQAARAWLDRIGLAPFADRFPAQLSGGMRKRVAMAQNWAMDRDILLMDEPFSALDVHTRQAMETELLTLWTGSSKTVVFVTHDLEEAIALADEVIVISAGPASRVVARHVVPLARPRDLVDIRTMAAFNDLYGTIWASLRGEVLKSREAGQAGGVDA